MLRRFGFALAYCLFVLFLLEAGLRLGGLAMRLRSQAAMVSDTTAADALRILAIGESTTFGLGVDHDMAYPAQLERLLNDEMEDEVLVVNAGVPGQTSTSILRSIEYQLRKYRPQIVIAMFGVNDANEATNDLSSRLLFGFYVPDIFVRLRLFRLATVVRDYVLTGMVLKPDGAWIFFDPEQRAADGTWIQNPYYYKQLELNYKDVLDAIESYGARPIVTSYLRSEQRLRKLLEKVARENGVMYLDMYSPATDAPEYFTEDRFHPSELGHQVIAAKIRDVLMQQGLLKR